MKERPILFSPLMVRALLAGTKTQTRRIIKPVRGFEHHNICKIGMPYAFDPWAVWWHGNETDRVGCLQECRYGKPQDQLWVREAWRTSACVDDRPGSDMEKPEKGYGYPIWYEADRGIVTWRGATDGGPGFINPGRYRNARFMPRWASRKFNLSILDVRSERLNDISESDARAEGIVMDNRGFFYVPGSLLTSIPTESKFATARACYKALWESINGDGSWALNPPVWAISFTRIV